MIRWLTHSMNSTTTKNQWDGIKLCRPQFANWAIYWKNRNLTFRSKFKVIGHYPWYATHCFMWTTQVPNIKSQYWNTKMLQPGHLLVTEINRNLTLRSKFKVICSYPCYTTHYTSYVGDLTYAKYQMLTSIDKKGNSSIQVCNG